MKENKLKVSFFVQAKRTDKKGLVPVIGRISVGRTHSGFSTKCKTPLTLWDSRKQRLVGKSAMAVSVNQKLGECTALIHARFHELNEREEALYRHRREGLLSGANSPPSLALGEFQRVPHTDKGTYRYRPSLEDVQTPYLPALPAP